MLYQIDLNEDQQLVIQTIGDKLGYSVQQGIEQIIQDTVDSLKLSHDLFHKEVDLSWQTEARSILMLGVQGSGKTVIGKEILQSSMKKHDLFDSEEIETIGSMLKRLGACGSSGQVRAVQKAVHLINSAPGSLDIDNAAVCLYHLAVALKGKDHAMTALAQAAALSDEYI